MEFTCEFCNKVFKSKSNFTSHQLNAKYCLKLRGIDSKTNYACNYCDKGFSRSDNLKIHVKSCGFAVNSDLNKKLAIDLEEYKAKCLSQQTVIIKTKKKLKQRIKDRDIRIIELEKQLEFEKGKSDGYKNSKPSKIVNTTNTNCNTVNSKLSNIQITTIKPFTLEGIAELLPFYTEERFLNKLPGIIATIIPFITLNVNGVIERNIVCTDLSRTICHLLSDKREWERDDGLTICAEIIKVFVPKMNEYMDVYNEKFKEADKFIQCASFAFMKTDEYKQCRKDFDTYYELMEELRPGFYSPASRGNGDDYNGMIKTFRDLLKPAIYVKPDKLLLK